MVHFAVAILLMVYIVDQANGHGMMLNPVGRQSRWRYNTTAPVNYNDNELFCGGYMHQWNVNKGNCGFCGDSYSLPAPRPHEIGGKFGEGVVVETYKSGDSIEISALLTTNHKGHFYYEICNLDFEKESDECFKKNLLKLPSGEDKYLLPSYEKGFYNATVMLPNELFCEHCILRWTYVAGNNWGICENGTGATGCGPQEHFRSCSDISIFPDFALW